MVEDIERQPLTYRPPESPAASRSAARCADMRPKASASALLLPNAAAAAVTFFALQAAGRVPAMLNFTPASRRCARPARPPRSARSSPRAASSSRRKLDAVVAALGQQVRDPLSGGRARATSSVGDKLRGCLATLAPRAAHRRRTRPARTPGRGPVHLGLGRPAEGRGAEPRQHPGQPPQLARAGRLQPDRHRVQRAAGVPLLRPDRRPLLPMLGGHPHVPLSLAAALPDRAGAGLRRPTPPSCSAPTPSSPAMPHGATPTISTACATSSPAPSGCRTRRGGVGGEVRPAHPRRLRRHRDGAGDRDQHADALQGRHGRPPAARHRAPAGADAGIERGGRWSSPDPT